MKNKFYSLFATLAGKYFWGAVSEKDFELIDKWVGKGMRGFKGVVHVRIIEGITPGDFFETGFPLLVVSSKVLKVWEQFGGFETYPVIIEGGVSPIEYSGVAFLGRGGPYDPVRSKAVYGKCMDTKGKPMIMNMDGLYFDDTQWDGSDLLTIDEFPCIPIVTERVAKAMKDAKVTSCRYTLLEKFCMYKK